jgi:integral membrane protein (TIGR01906 family)
VLGYVIGFWAREATCGGHQSLIGLAFGALVVGGVGVVAAFGFEPAFDRFHTVLFRNDFWQLNARTDHLLQMFPEAFWRDMSIVLGSMCAIEGC